MPFGSTFTLYLKTPDGLLGEHISLIWASEGTPPFGQERIVPDGASVLLFNLGKPVDTLSGTATVQLQKTLFTGVFSRFSTLDYSIANSEHQQVGVIFKPAGAFPFIKNPIINFKEIAVETTAFAGATFNHIYEQLASQSTATARIQTLESCLWAILQKNIDPTLVPDLVELIRSNPQWSVKQLAQKSGYSQQHLNRLLGKYAGTNAKELQRIFRVNRAMGIIQNLALPIGNLTNIAYQCHYFDQAHFIHDFKTMTGLTPSAYWAIQQPTTSRVLYL